jgi:hypothetical protein
MKMSAIIEDFSAADLRAYGRVCGWALALVHARSGDAAIIAGYMGSSEVFDDALCDFAVDYADQSDRDYKAFVKAVREGRIKATMEGEPSARCPLLALLRSAGRGRECLMLGIDRK